MLLGSTLVGLGIYQGKASRHSIGTWTFGPSLIAAEDPGHSEIGHHDVLLLPFLLTF